MQPFDQAWALLKMPIYETGVPGIRFVTQGADEPNWKQQENVYGYVPTDPTDYSVKQGEIAQMTPAEYNKLVTGSVRGPVYYSKPASFNMPHISELTGLSLIHI